MLFESSVRKELARNFSATLIVLMTIVMTMILIRTLGQVSQGRINPAEIGLILGFNLIAQLPIILSISLFITTVSTLSRLYLESEMVIWLSAGQSLRQFLRPIWRFAWPIFLGIAALTIFIWPWSNQQSEELRSRYERRGNLERVQAGEFQESANGKTVFFVTKRSNGQTDGNNVFIFSAEHGKEIMTSAHSAHTVPDANGYSVILDVGQQVETTATDGDVKVSEFKVYGNAMHSELQDAAPVTTRVQTTWNLLKNPTAVNRAELFWRLSIVLSSVLLLFIALVTTRANPRVGRGGNLAFALLFYMVYNNLINAGQSWVAAEKISVLSLSLSLHGGVFCVGLIGLFIRQYNLSLPTLVWRT